MTRAEALAYLAADCMRQGSLLQYEAGEVLVVDHLLGGGEAVVVAVGTENHLFEASRYKPALGDGPPAFGYSVDVRA